MAARIGKGWTLTGLSQMLRDLQARQATRAAQPPQLPPPDISAFASQRAAIASYRNIMPASAFPAGGSGGGNSIWMRPAPGQAGDGGYVGPYRGDQIWMGTVPGSPWADFWGSSGAWGFLPTGTPAGYYDRPQWGGAVWNVLDSSPLGKKIRARDRAEQEGHP